MVHYHRITKPLFQAFQNTLKTNRRTKSLIKTTTRHLKIVNGYSICATDIDSLQTVMYWMKEGLVGKSGLVVGLETRDLGHWQSLDNSGIVAETSK